MKNMKVGVQILLSSGITLVLAVLMVIVSIIEINAVQAKYQGILSGQIVAVHSVQSSETELNAAARLLRDMALFGYSVFLLQHRQGGSVYNPGCDGKAGTPS